MKKRNIHERFRGGMFVEIENFKKLVETKLGDTKPLVKEQENDKDTFFKESYIDPLLQKGFVEVKEVNLPDGTYSKGGAGYRINILSGEQDTGYRVVVNSGIRGMFQGEISVTNKQPDASKYGGIKGIFFKDMGFKPTQQSEEVKTITNKVASEGIKNVTSQMISSPPFAGTYSGYVFGGTFGGVEYEWDCNGVEGMSGIRGMLDGKILTETVENMVGAIKKTVDDAKPGSVSVGFYSSQAKFIIYTTAEGKPKCLNF